MSKLNTKGSRPAPKKTYKASAIKHIPLETSVGVSKNGNIQWNKEPLQHLYELVVSTLLGKDTFYRSSDELVRNMIAKVDEAVRNDALDFVANLAIHARTQMNIRSLPVMVVVQFARALRDHNKTYDNMRRLTADVIQRADQITDLYAYALEVFGDKKKIPMAIKRGVGDAFNKFNEYHFGKYNRDGSVKFRDVLRIVHPVASNEAQGAIFEKIIKETLATPFTWETELTANGQRVGPEKEDPKTLWTRLVESRKLGYMALRKNVRNIIEADVDSEVLRQHVAGVLADPKRVAESKEFPFSFIQARDAVREAGGNRIVESALDKAIDLSVLNIPLIGNKPVIIVDKSGSMDSGDTTARGFTPFNQASTLAAMLVKAHADAEKLAVIVFGSTAEIMTDINPNDSVNTIVSRLKNSRAGGGTDFSTALRALGALNFHPDVVIVLTDGEINKLWYAQHSIPAKAIKIAVNMNAADTTPFPQRDGWFPLAGWSDKMFRFIPALRESVSVVDMLAVPYIGVEAMKAQPANEE